MFEMSPERLHRFLCSDWFGKYKASAREKSKHVGVCLQLTLGIHPFTTCSLAPGDEFMIKTSFLRPDILLKGSLFFCRPMAPNLSSDVSFPSNQEQLDIHFNSEDDGF